MKDKLILTMVLAAFLIVGLAAADNHSTNVDIQNNETNESVNDTLVNQSVNQTDTVLQVGENDTQQNVTGDTNQTQDESDVQITTSVTDEFWIFLGVLISLILVVSLITYVRNHGGMPWTSNMEKARNLHRRAQRLHRKGNEDKAKKLYERAKYYREAEV